MITDLAYDELALFVAMFTVLAILPALAFVYAAYTNLQDED